MKHLLSLMILAAVVVVSSGCSDHHVRRNGCDTCHQGGRGGGLLAKHRCRGCGVGGRLHGGLCASCGRGGHGAGGAAAGELQGGGPPMAQYAYPYYTVRGPRDFLMNNPPPLGP